MKQMENEIWNTFNSVYLCIWEEIFIIMSLFMLFGVNKAVLIWIEVSVWWWIDGCSDLHVMLLCSGKAAVAGHIIQESACFSLSARAHTCTHKCTHVHARTRCFLCKTWIKRTAWIQYNPHIAYFLSLPWSPLLTAQCSALEKEI